MQWIDRMRQVKILLVNLFAVGTPMIMMGDEFLRSQFGNNNAYCQDNTISYFSWRSTPYREECDEDALDALERVETEIPELNENKD